MLLEVLSTVAQLYEKSHLKRLAVGSSNNTIVELVSLVQYRLVTDRPMGRHTMTAWHFAVMIAI